MSQWKWGIPFIRGLKPSTVGGVVGLDIGPDYLKVIKIKSSEGNNMVENYAISPLPSGVVVKDEIKNYSAIGMVLNEMFRQAGISTKEVVLAIPRSIAIIKTITVDSRLNADDIESRAWIEASRHFPDLIGDIYLDFAVIGPSAQDASQLELVLVACRKDQIKPYLEVLHQAGLVAKMVDINSYALERALPLTLDMALESSTILALLNVNINLSTFIVVQGQTLVHAHDQSFDGQRLQTQTKAYLKEKPLVEGMDLLNDPAYTNILKENMLSHLRHTIHFFYSSRPNINIQKIIISGDCASLPGLIPFIEKEIGISALMANPFQHMSFARHIDQQEIAKNAPALMLCCGLALSKLEFE